MGGDIQQFSYLIEDTLNRTEIKDIEENKIFTGDIKWSGFEEKYFITALIPNEEQDQSYGFLSPKMVKVLFG